MIDHSKKFQSDVKKMTQPNKNNWFYLILLCVLLISTSCTIPLLKNDTEIAITSQPPVIESVDISPFQSIGCMWQTENYATCPAESIPKKMGCDTLTTPNDYLNLIDANSQFVNCSYAPLLQNPPDETESKGLYNSGCSTTVYQRLLAYKDGDYLLIRDLEDLKYYFSPIDSQEKALGYAIAATGYTPLFSFDQMENYRILVDELEPTQLKSSSESYEINLFDYQMCGCGPHPHIMKWVKITINGDLEILESTPVFENPEEDDLCVD